MTSQGSSIVSAPPACTQLSSSALPNTTDARLLAPQLPHLHDGGCRGEDGGAGRRAAHHHLHKRQPARPGQAEGMSGPADVAAAGRSNQAGRQAGGRKRRLALRIRRMGCSSLNSAQLNSTFEGRQHSAHRLHHVQRGGGRRRCCACHTTHDQILGHVGGAAVLWISGKSCEARQRLDWQVGAAWCTGMRLRHARSWLTCPCICACLPA